MKQANSTTRKNQRPLIGLLRSTQPSYPLGKWSRLPKGALFFASFLAPVPQLREPPKETREARTSSQTPIKNQMTSL